MSPGGRWCRSREGRGAREGRKGERIGVEFGRGGGFFLSLGCQNVFGHARWNGHCSWDTLFSVFWTLCIWELDLRIVFRGR